jgi:hypothetical protein
VGARCVKQRGSVVAFESSPANLEVLKYDKRVNRLRRVEIVPKAVSNMNSSAFSFFLVDGGFGFRNSLVIGLEPIDGSEDDWPYSRTKPNPGSGRILKSLISARTGNRQEQKWDPTEDACLSMTRT